MTKATRVRFAPSPTGYLHIGGARTALFNWIYAQKHQGTFVLRIEDTDPSRSKREHELQIERDMSWLNLDWQEGPSVGGDHGPYRQSERFDSYDIVIDQLLQEGKAYRCIATSEELDALRAGQKERGEKMMYDNRYRDANLGVDCGEHVIRLKTPLEGETVVDDKIKGRTVFQNKELDDFILRRSDGTPTYNFVCVVDDLGMDISLVLRGDDHLNNTPKQVLLYQALGQDAPEFAHVPMILGDDGKRLSKRHGATAVGLYQEMGILKEALFNYLTRLGWACGDMEIFTPAEVIEVFELSQINKAGAKWDMQKLLWCNQQWMMRLNIHDLVDRARPFIKAHSTKHGYSIPEDKLTAAVATMQERAQTLVELADYAAFLAQKPPFRLDEKCSGIIEEGKPILSKLENELSKQEGWDKDSISQALNKFCEKNELKFKQIGMPLRVALTGTLNAPGVSELLLMYGKNEALNRIHAAVN